VIERFLIKRRRYDIMFATQMSEKCADNDKHAEAAVYRIFAMLWYNILLLLFCIKLLQIIILLQSFFIGAMTVVR